MSLYIIIFGAVFILCQASPIRIYDHVLWLPWHQDHDALLIKFSDIFMPLPSSLSLSLTAPQWPKAPVQIHVHSIIANMSIQCAPDLSADTQMTPFMRISCALHLHLANTAWNLWVQVKVSGYTMRDLHVSLFFLCAAIELIKYELCMRVDFSTKSYFRTHTHENMTDWYWEHLAH